MSRIVDFYRGETLHEPSRAVPGSPTIEPAGDLEAKSRRWLTSGNHNPLSITRILRSMVLLGLKREAVEWFAALQRVYVAGADVIGRPTYERWRDAVEGRYRP